LIFRAIRLIAIITSYVVELNGFYCFNASRRKTVYDFNMLPIFCGGQADNPIDFFNGVKIRNLILMS
jgi:hypothetical protein